MRLCIHCRHCIPHPIAPDQRHLSMCAQGPKPESEDARFMVTGERQQTHEFCSTMRVRLPDLGGCGPDAVLYEAIKVSA